MQYKNADRLAPFSDALFAVIATVMVLELKAPEASGFSALVPLWPTAISYAVSYLFIAIIWTRGVHACLRAFAACRTASIAHRPHDFRHRDTGRVHGTACRLRA